VRRVKANDVPYGNANTRGSVGTPVNYIKTTDSKTLEAPKMKT